MCGRRRLTALPHGQVVAQGPHDHPQGDIHHVITGAASIGKARQVTGRETQPSTSGGTSDGRFIATMGTQVVELGPVNATIHQVNECIKADDLDLLTDIYQVTLERLLT